MAISIEMYLMYLIGNKELDIIKILLAIREET